MHFCSVRSNALLLRRSKRSVESKSIFHSRDTLNVNLRIGVCHWPNDISKGLLSGKIGNGRKTVWATYFPFDETCLHQLNGVFEERSQMVSRCAIPTEPCP